MGAAMRYQPQGLARLDRSNPLVSGAQAIISAAHTVNLASQASLKNGGTVNRSVLPVGKSFQFRKNGYTETELLPAIGTASYVEFWYGYPSSDTGSKGAAGGAGFLTGSSNNSTGIAATLGLQGSYAIDSGSAGHWGAVQAWGTLNSSGEALTPGALTLLVIVRRQNKMELWRDGILRASIAQAPTNYAASNFIVGSFVEDAGYWPSSSDTVLAGRIIGEWSADQVKQFSANPWQIFTAGSGSSAYQAAIASASASSGGVVATNTPVNPASASLGLTGYAPTVIRGASVAIGLAPGSLSIAGYAPAVTQGTTTSVVPGGSSFSIAGYAPSITQSINSSITPGSASLALTGYAPTVARTANQSQTPQPGALAITGYAPTVVRLATQSIQPPVSGMALRGYAPSVVQSAPVIAVAVRFNILPRNFNIKTTHFSN